MTEVPDAKVPAPGTPTNGTPEPDERGVAGPVPSGTAAPTTASARASDSGVTVRPIRFTAHPAEFGRMLRGLGAVEVVSTDEQAVYRAGSGRIAVRAVDHGDPYAGLTLMSFECADPGAVQIDERLLDEDADRPPRAAAAGDGVVLTFEPITVPETGSGNDSGNESGIGAGEPAEHSDDSDDAPGDIPVGRPDSALAIVPIWMTTEVSVAADALKSLGFVRRLSSDSGVWVDLAGSGDTHGLVAVHHEDGDADIIMAFEYSGELADLQARMRRYGVDAPIIDENYARTLRLPDPDNETEIWVNEAMRDTYGYQHG